MSTSADDLAANPPWRVQVVLDDKGLGGDFAYTIGLAELGYPELHLYARPSLGDDPGADWRLDTNDCGHLLNELGAMMVRGELGVGSHLERRYDDGLARVVLQVDSPEDPALLKALGIDAAAEVLPVRWSLHRCPEAVPVPLTPAERYGPMTPLVRERWAEVQQAEPALLLELLEVAGLVWGATGSLSHPASRAFGLARTVGRTAALHVLVDDVLAWVAELTVGEAVAASTWGRVLAALDHDLPADVEGRAQAVLALRHLLTDVVCSLLCVEAVSDVAEPALLRAGRGPWCAAQSPSGVAAGDAWCADAHVGTEVVELVSALKPATLHLVAKAHRQARNSTGLYPGLVARLLGLAAVGPAGIPVLHDSCGAPLTPAAQEWAAVLAAALTYRGRLSTEELATLVEVVDELVPQLGWRLQACADPGRAP